MMTHLTQSDVFRAADQLYRAGKSTSVAAVRDHLGRGSHTTIARHMRSWRNQHERLLLNQRVEEELRFRSLDARPTGLGAVRAAGNSEPGHPAASHPESTAPPTELMAHLQAIWQAACHTVRDGTNPDSVARVEHLERRCDKLEAEVCQLRGDLDRLHEQLKMSIQHNNELLRIFALSDESQARG